MKKAIIAAAGILSMVLVTAGGVHAAQIQPSVAVSGVLNGVCKAGTNGDKQNLFTYKQYTCQLWKIIGLFRGAGGNGELCGCD